MKFLQERIVSEGRYLGGGILKVDSFMNHQIDSLLMRAVGVEFARRFKPLSPTKILTAESSGIAPALAAGIELEIPIIFARKHQPVTMAASAIRETTVSHTHGGRVELIIAPEYLTQKERILIIDDFLASAKTIMGLASLVRKTPATLVGIGAVIEKSFEGGRALLKVLDVPVESLVAIAEFRENEIIFL